jgi:dihydrofolate synthase/folylpolyglutamate synthase
VSDWSLDRAQEHLLSLELFGMRFGLERMHRLLAALGSPQEGMRAVHVVGTNGKSSTVRMTAAILEAHGLRTGAFLSPHLQSFAERIRIGGQDLPAASFASVVERIATTARAVEAELPADDRVTQFELLTAAALSEFATHAVDVAVVEAGLGGRYDATNVLGAEVVVLTSVGLEHTRWLGETLTDIAREKLAVVDDGATLVVGDVDPEVMIEVTATAERRRARVVEVRSETGRAPDGRGRAAMGVPPGYAGLAGYQRGNFALALAASEAVLGELDPVRVAAAAGGVSVPGRLQVVGHSPPVIFDGAHNPAGVATLVRALDEVVGTRPLVAVVSILDDKDADAMLDQLLPRVAAFVFTRADNPRSLGVEELRGLLPDRGPRLHSEPDPHRATELARRIAGPEGAVLVTGSLHLVGELLADPGHRVASAL